MSHTTTISHTPQSSSVAEAAAVLRDALAMMPGADEGVRSDFFAQWRRRVLDAVEQAWPGEEDAGREFREIEFGPRRMSGDENADEPAVRATFAAGLDVAKTVLEALVNRLPPPEPPGKPFRDLTAMTPKSMPVAPPALPHAAHAGSPSVAPSCQSTHSPFPRPRDERGQPRAAHAPAARAASPRIASARAAVGRALAAWEQGDRTTAELISAQLYAELMLLAEDPAFRSTLSGVASKAFGDEGEEAASTVVRHGPMSMWCVLFAMTRAA